MSDSPSAIKVAVVGVGRMGGHHARTYSNLEGANLVAVVDFDRERAGETAGKYGCQAFGSAEELLAEHPDLGAVTVAVPTAFHVAAATPFLKAGIACLVEKPLAPTAEASRDLVELAEKHQAILQVGHTERFNPAVRAVANLGMRPRFIEVDRISPMTFRSLDVGVVMDMMIHDLDIVLMLADSELESVSATGVSVIGEYEDVANARLVFKNGCVANITASRLAMKTERKMRLFSEHAYVSLDYQRRDGVVIELSGNDQALADVRQRLANGEDMSNLDYSELVSIDQLNMDPKDGETDPLTAELRSLLQSVKTGDRPEVDGKAGHAAVQAAQRVVAAIAEHKWEGVERPRVS